MKIKYIIILIFVILVFSSDKLFNKYNFYDYQAKGLNGEKIIMNKYKGKKILIVNVASKCGFTSQYRDLQSLHTSYGDNLVVLGFPSNDFFYQEPGTNSEIQKFCQINYGVTFQMFEKIHVKGKKIHPIYKWLSESSLNGWNNQGPTWNFNKYLINESGELIKYYGSRTNPTDTSITNYIKEIK